MTKITALIDGQFGSTGKGNIVAKIASEYSAHVRVGSPNAGHSFKINGSTHVNQIVPVGWKNPDAELFIGRGALVNPRILTEEVEKIERIDPTIRERLFIDARAGVLSPWHEEAEGHTSGELHQRIGSTGEGVGAARIDRIKRDPEFFKLFGELELDGFNTVTSVAERIAERSEQGESTLLEGAQGSGLDLIHGTWPYCTSNGTGAAQLAADIGVPPQRVTDVIMVLRTFPIRVAGNSGPLKDEITWEELSEELGIDLTPEKTTVTKKIRRIGRWDADLVREAVVLNAPTAFAINFIDYINPADAGVKSYDALSAVSRTFIEQVEREYKTPVHFVGTGGSEWEVIDRR